MEWDGCGHCSGFSDGNSNRLGCRHLVFAVVGTAIGTAAGVVGLLVGMMTVGSSSCSRTAIDFVFAKLILVFLLMLPCQSTALSP